MRIFTSIGETIRARTRMMRGFDVLIFAVLACTEVLAIFNVVKRLHRVRSILLLNSKDIYAVVWPAGFLVLHGILVFRKFPNYEQLGWTVDRKAPDYNLRVHRYFGQIWICFLPQAYAFPDARGGGHVGYGYAQCMVTPRPQADVLAEKLKPLFSEYEISGDLILLRKERIVFDKTEFPKLLRAINERLSG